MLTSVLPFLFSLQYVELLSFTSTNVALKKHATQSATYNAGTHAWSASHAVDGDKTCTNPPTWDHYSATLSDIHSWWRVDLQQGYEISRVVVYGRPTVTNDQLAGFRLFLTDTAADFPDPSTSVYNNTFYNSNGVFNISTSKRARYCLLVLPIQYSPIVLCEVEVFSTVAGITTSISSVGTYNGPPNTWSSSNVIDNVYHGDPNTCKCCAGTSGREPPWLQIDLGIDKRVSIVTIYGRIDGSIKEQYKNIYVFVSNTSMEAVTGSLVYRGNPTDGNYTFILSFQPPISFRYLMLRRLITSVMTICEVQFTDTSSNLCDRLRGTAITSQSSTLLNSTDYTASNAIDGKKNYDVDHCKCCSVTSDTTSPSWWQIDLRNKYTVDKVEIFGRQSYAPEQLQQARLYAGNTSMETGHLVYTIPTITSSSHFVHELHHPITAQFFFIKFEYYILTLCEFKLYGEVKSCDTGSYGAACSLKCFCADRKICNSLTGECQTPECLPGWTGQSCNRACLVGAFGHNCTSHCHCFNQTPCDSVSGICNIGYCDPGWQGQSCSQECPMWHFGMNCSSTCHCLNGTDCNHVNGVCDIGYCDPGWQGVSCSEAGFLLIRLRDHATTQMSSVVHNWTSERAIDGCVGPDPDQCQCCSGTDNSALSWWRLDLGRLFPIKSVIIYSRNKEKFYRQLNGFNLYLTNTSSQNSTALNMAINTNKVGYAFELAIPMILARFVTITRPGVLTICEVMISEGECQIGTYGEECQQVCNCADNKPCSREIGSCQTSICKTGWTGDACGEHCPQDTYGDECKEKCFCATGTCTSNHGICSTGCKQGYHGAQCNIVSNLTRELITKGEQKSRTSIIIGASAGGSVAFLLIALSVVYLVFRCQRKRRHQDEQKTNYAVQTPNTLSTYDSDYDTLDTVQDSNVATHNNPYTNTEL